MDSRARVPRGWEGERLSDASIAVARSRHARTSDVAQELAAAGAEVTLLGVSRSIVEQLRLDPPDVVVIDHSNDDFNVSRLCASVYDSVGVPILVCTTTEHSTDDAMVELLRSGASAVIGPEAGAARLLAQLRAMLRLTVRRPRSSNRLTVGDVTIDVDNHHLTIGGATVSCSPLLRRLLASLAESPNEVVSKQTLLARGWGADTAAPIKRVRFAIASLRKLLGSGPRRPRIETVPPGYRLTVPE